MKKQTTTETLTLDPQTIVETFENFANVVAKLQGQIETLETRVYTLECETVAGIAEVRDMLTLLAAGEMTPAPAPVPAVNPLAGLFRSPAKTSSPAKKTAKAKTAKAAVVPSNDLAALVAEAAANVKANQRKRGFECNASIIPQIENDPRVWLTSAQHRPLKAAFKAAGFKARDLATAIAQAM